MSSHALVRLEHPEPGAKVRQATTSASWSLLSPRDREPGNWSLGCQALGWCPEDVRDSCGSWLSLGTGGEDSSEKIVSES